jgi:small subunit ribosomal protein S21
MVEVYVDGNIEVALKMLKKKIGKDGILRQLKLRSTFESRTQRRRRKEAEAAKRRKKREVRTEYFVRTRTQQDYAAMKKQHAEEAHGTSIEPFEPVEVRQENGE